MIELISGMGEKQLKPKQQQNPKNPTNKPKTHHNNKIPNPLKTRADFDELGRRQFSRFQLKFVRNPVKSTFAFQPSRCQSWDLLSGPADGTCRPWWGVTDITVRTGTICPKKRCQRNLEDAEVHRLWIRTFKSLVYWLLIFAFYCTCVS